MGRYDEGKARRVSGDASGQEERGRGCGDEDDDSADQNEADGHHAKSSDRGREDVEEEPQVYQEHNTRRAREQRG